MITKKAGLLALMMLVAVMMLGTANYGHASTISADQSTHATVIPARTNWSFGFGVSPGYYGWGPGYGYYAAPPYNYAPYFGFGYSPGYYWRPHYRYRDWDDYPYWRYRHW